MKWTLFNNYNSGEEVPVKNTLAFVAGGVMTLIGVAIGLNAKNVTDAGTKVAKAATSTRSR